MSKKLDFRMRCNQYELRACPKHLVSFYDGEPNVTIDFIRWNDDDTTCYSIGYFYYYEPCWELKFVGDRFLEVSQDDIKAVWNMLVCAYKCLDEWSADW